MIQIHIEIAAVFCSLLFKYFTFQDFSTHCLVGQVEIWATAIDKRIVNYETRLIGLRPSFPITNESTF